MKMLSTIHVGKGDSMKSGFVNKDMYNRWQVTVESRCPIIKKTKPCYTNKSKSNVLSYCLKNKITVIHVYDGGGYEL